MALPYATIEKAKSVTGVVELEIAASVLALPLYKPTAIDGYGEGSRFKPDHTDDFHGWSDPDSGFQQRPELVSKAVAYHDLINNTISDTDDPPRTVQVTVSDW